MLCKVTHVAGCVSANIRGWPGDGGRYLMHKAAGLTQKVGRSMQWFFTNSSKHVLFSLHTRACACYVHSCSMRNGASCLPSSSPIPTFYIYASLPIHIYTPPPSPMHLQLLTQYTMQLSSSQYSTLISHILSSHTHTHTFSSQWLELFLFHLLSVIFLIHECTTFTHCPGISSDSATGESPK